MHDQTLGEGVACRISQGDGRHVQSCSVGFVLDSLQEDGTCKLNIELAAIKPLCAEADCSRLEGPPGGGKLIPERLEAHTSRRRPRHRDHVGGGQDGACGRHSVP